MPAKAPARGRKRIKSKWPDLSPFNLWNPIDIANAHELLVSLGLASRDYDGLREVALAAVLARRLATKNPAGYFARILRDGFGKFGPADRDRDAAKRIMREING